MKRLLFLITLLMVALAMQAQRKVTDMPVDNALESTDILYIIHGGVTGKQMAASTFLVAVHDSVQAVISAMNDSLATIRALVAGGGAFSKIGNKVYVTDTDDSVSVGNQTPEYKVDITGDLRTTGYAYLDRVLFGGSTASGQIWSTGDDLFFSDNSGGWGVEGVTLQQLRDGFYILNNVTYTPPVDNNFNFGGLEETLYKVKVDGTFNATGNSYLDGDILFSGSGGGYGSPNPRITKTGNTLMFGDASGTYALSDLASSATGNVTVDTVHYDGTRDIKTYQDVSGNFVINIDNTPIYYSLSGTQSQLETDQIFADSIMVGLVWFNSDDLSAGGAGVVDTTGLPVAGRNTVFTAANKIGSYADYTYNGTTGQLYVGNAYYVTGAKSYVNPAVTNNEGNIANLFGTNTSYTSNAIMMQVNNNATQKFYVKTDTTVAVNNLKFRGDLYSWKLRGLTDTVAAVWYPGGKADSASVVFSASDIWDKPLEDFDSWYSKSEKLKALPLPYPNGTERRKMNALYMAYQTEATLETLAMYHKELRDKVKDMEKENAKLREENKRKNIRELRKRVDDLEERVLILEKLMK